MKNKYDSSTKKILWQEMNHLNSLSSFSNIIDGSQGFKKKKS